MRRIAWVIAGITLVLLVALPVWWALPPESPMFAALGVPGPAADAGGRHCETMYRRTPVGWIPLREGHCAAADPERPMNTDRVTYDRLTRRISSITVTRAPLDSATWHFQFDSIARAITGRGGAPINCSASHRSRTHIEVTRAWRLDEFDLRLTAYHFRGHAPRGPEWLLVLQSVAPRAPECDVRAAPA